MASLRLSALELAELELTAKDLATREGINADAVTLAVPPLTEVDVAVRVFAVAEAVAHAVLVVADVLRSARPGEDAEAVSLQTLLETEHPEEYLRPVDSMFRNYPALTLTQKQETRCRNGNSFTLKIADGTYRVYSQNGTFLALSKVDSEIMSTIKSFFEVE